MSPCSIDLGAKALGPDLRLPGPRTRGAAPPPAPAPGFTLAELLVVLAIIALLGALAVPALRAALDRADRTICLSNLRQMGQAFAEYTADRGHYPPAEELVTDASGAVVERRRWYHALAPYLDAGPAAWSSGQGRAAIDPETGLAASVVLPSDDDADQDVFPDVFRCPRRRDWEIGRNLSYGYNHQYLGDGRLLPDGRRRSYPIAPTDLLDRSRTAVVMDSAGTGTGPYRSARAPSSAAIGNHAFTVDPQPLPERGGVRLGSDAAVPGVGSPTLPSRPDGRHRGGVCVLFADSHTSWIALADLLRDDALFNGTGRPSTP